MRFLLPHAFLGCLLLLLTAAGMPTSAAAQDAATPIAAGMIVDTGEGDPLYVVVASADDSLSAVDLIREADLPLVTVEFGGLGEGVCEIVDTGCDVSACRQRLCQTGDPGSSFWQFWVQSDDGQWALSPLGGSHHGIEDGDVTAWVWAGVDPELEPLTWEQLANRAGAPRSVVDRSAALPEGAWTSDIVRARGNGDPSMAEMLASTALIVMIGGAGYLLARRRRTARAA